MRTSNSLDLPVLEPYPGTLPAIVKTRGGCLFDPHQDEWNLRELTFRVTLYFDRLRDLGDDFKAAFRSTLVWYAQNESLGHLRNMYCWARQLFEFKADTTGMPVVEISSVDLLNYKVHLGTDREWYMGMLSGFLKQWHRLGYAGITEDANVLLNQLRLKGSPIGVATATMDPVKGPFTALEFEALQHALNGAYGLNEVTLAEYVLCWLFMILGMRPTQYAALKVCDVVHVHEKDGSSTYSVRVPRAKTRDSDARGQFKDRLLIPQIGKLVVSYAAEVQSRFTALIEDSRQAPLFPDDRVESGLDDRAYHLQSCQVGDMLNNVFNKLNVVSERTGDRIKINPKRFRTTIGTRAAEEGHGELVIAELLDHSDTRYVGVYVRAMPAIVERIDRAIAVRMAPLAQAFAGRLIESASDASRNADPTSQIRAPGITGTFNAISSCGKHGFCGFLKPVACYTCNSFEPWLGGPHELVLEHLIAERERLMATGDVRIASINDRAILAVAEVIQLCATERAQRSAIHD